MEKAKRFLLIAFSIICLIVPFNIFANEPFGFNPLKLELGSSSELLEEEHPSMELIGGDYRSGGTGYVTYYSEFYYGYCWFKMITDEYAINGILVGVYAETEASQDHIIEDLIKVMKSFDNNIEAELTLEETKHFYRMRIIHDRYSYAIHIPLIHTYFDWTVFITKTYNSMGF